MITFDRNENGELFSNVTNEKTREKFIILSSCSSQGGEWQVDLLQEAKSRLFGRLKSPAKGIICVKAPSKEDAEEAVHKLAEMSENCTVEYLRGLFIGSAGGMS